MNFKLKMIKIHYNNKLINKVKIHGFRIKILNKTIQNNNIIQIY